MLIIVAMAVVVGAIGNYLVPLMIGAPDMSIPRLNALFIWLLMISICVLMIASVIEEGPGIG